jgi:hypothetical protein
MGPTCFEYRERYLLETVGCYYCTAKVSIAVEMLRECFSGGMGLLISLMPQGRGLGTFVDKYGSRWAGQPLSHFTTSYPAAVPAYGYRRLFIRVDYLMSSRISGQNLGELLHRNVVCSVYYWQVFTLIDIIKHIKGAQITSLQLFSC